MSESEQVTSIDSFTVDSNLSEAVKLAFSRMIASLKVAEVNVSQDLLDTLAALQTRLLEEKDDLSKEDLAVFEADYSQLSDAAHATMLLNDFSMLASNIQPSAEATLKIGAAELAYQLTSHANELADAHNVLAVAPRLNLVHFMSQVRMVRTGVFPTRELTDEQRSTVTQESRDGDLTESPVKYLEPILAPKITTLLNKALEAQAVDKTLSEKTAKQHIFAVTQRKKDLAQAAVESAMDASEKKYKVGNAQDAYDTLESVLTKTLALDMNAPAFLDCLIALVGEETAMNVLMNTGLVLAKKDGYGTAVIATDKNLKLSSDDFFLMAGEAAGRMIAESTPESSVASRSRSVSVESQNSALSMKSLDNTDLKKPKIFTNARAFFSHTNQKQFATFENQVFDQVTKQFGTDAALNKIASMFVRMAYLRPASTNLMTKFVNAMGASDRLVRFFAGAWKRHHIQKVDKLVKALEDSNDANQVTKTVADMLPEAVLTKDASALHRTMTVLHERLLKPSARQQLNNR
ncbi:MAG: hypothetical protein DHS20C10_13570 [marine bacterium B5-7]|nr:MAG: hypothetical protein DHS20C10_13570 [marine bacterium B5-7]